ncbi:MAG: FG-GAP-like repeat-containing protein [candidate division WOR-3 bacterium]
MREIKILVILCFLMFASSMFAQLSFEDVTGKSGIVGNGNVGFSWGDYNNDGLIDFFHSSAGKLYINMGIGDTFALVSKNPDPSTATTYGSLMADFTVDGNLDLLMTQGNYLSLVENTGDTLSFPDITSAVGLNLITIPSGNIAEAAAADFDRDGRLEIAFAGGYGANTQTPVRLAKLNTGTGQYEDVASGVLDDITHQFEAWNPAWVDVNNDGYLDLFMPSIRSNFPTNRSGLYINNNGSALNWSEIIVDGSARNVSAIASAWGDIDNDGDMDLIAQAFTDDGGALNVLLNNGDGTFTDATGSSGIVANVQMRGLSLGDYDNDGDLDLLIGGGGMDLTIYQNQLIESSALTFTNVTASTVGTGIQQHRSALFIDYNNDGKLDIFAGWTSSTFRLFRNKVENTNNWIGFRLAMIGTYNKSAIGARIKVEAGSLSMIRDIQAGGCGGMTGGNIWANFGLGENTSATVTVYWPNGVTQVIGDLAINQYHYLESPLAPPALLSPENNAVLDPGDVTLEWQELPDVDGYHLQVARDANFSELIVDEYLSETSYILTSLSYGERLYWHVSSYIEDEEESEFSGAWTFRIRTIYTDVTTILPAPTANPDLGFSWGDYDDDWDLDLYIPGASGKGSLMRNEGESFTLIKNIGVGYKQGSAFADVDNDGNLDLVVQSGNRIIVYYGNLENATLDSTILGPIGSGNLGNPAVGDYNQDGLLDIAAAGNTTGSGGGTIIGLYKQVSPRSFELASGDATADLDTTDGRKFESWNMAFLDVDNDGDLDLWAPSIRSDWPTNKSAIYINNGGKFGQAQPIIVEGNELNVSAIASAWGDFDNDGDYDLLAQGLGADGGRLYLLKNLIEGGTLVFDTLTAATGLGIAQNAAYRGFSWGDFDNDGDLDLVAGTAGADFKVYSNNGDGTFSDVSSEAVGSIGQHRRSVLFVDYNNDGKLDIYTNYQANRHLLRNDLVDPGNWIGFRLAMIGTYNKSAIGARIKVEAGSLSMIRDIQAGGCGGMTGGNIWANFGLGENTSATVTVYWPNGVTQVIGDLAINQYHYLNNAAEVPPAPTLVSPPNGAENQPLSLNLIWNKVLTATGYRCQVATTETFEDPSIIVDATSYDTVEAISGLTENTQYYWRVLAFNSLGEGEWSSVWSFKTLAQGVLEEALPKVFALRENGSLVNTKAVITYDVPHESSVRIVICDLLGREIASLVNEVKKPGRYTVDWNVGNLKNGVYFCKMEASNFTAVRKLILMK